MIPFSLRERAASLERMAHDGVDIFIIGGGITGAAVAMDASARGYQVGLVEKSDFASGTSSKSTKLVHGGIRYLPQFDFPLVHEALVERGLLFRNAPWIVSPLGFLIPIYRWSRRPLGIPFALPRWVSTGLVVRAGLLLYDLLAGRANVHRHTHVSRANASERAPALKTRELSDAYIYYDGLTDDARLTTTVMRTAVCHGAQAANYTEVTGFELIDGLVAAAQVRDTTTGQSYSIKAKHFINAGGVFAQRIEELVGLGSNLTIEPAKGVHLVFSRDRLPMTENAVVLPETSDGRLMFLVPWHDRVIVGTTDTTDGDVDHPAATDDDVTFLLEHCQRYLNASLKRDDILSTFAGYRPLIRSRNASKATSGKLSRSHAVLDGPGGMISVVGGKLTTWRRMGEDAMNFVARRESKPPSSITRHMPLDGTNGWPAVLDEDEPAALGQDREVLVHLGSAYGANMRQVRAIAEEDKRFAQRIVPALPYVMAEIVYACRHEMAMTLEDALARRTRLTLLDKQQGVSAARDVATVMAAELGWSEQEVSRQIAAYKSAVHANYQEIPPGETLLPAASFAAR